MVPPEPPSRSGGYANPALRRKQELFSAQISIDTCALLGTYVCRYVCSVPRETLRQVIDSYTQPEHIPRPMGAHSTYTVEVADKICEWISEGKTLMDFCRQEGMPSFATVYRWQDEHTQFMTAFMRARDIGHDVIAEDAMRIANTPIDGLVVETVESGNGPEARRERRERREDMLGHRKLQVETRLKLLAKWNPRKYGEKLEHSGDVGVRLSDLLTATTKEG